MRLIRPATLLWLHGDTAHSLEPLSTLVLSQRLQLPGADQRTAEMKECGASSRSTFQRWRPSRMVDSTPRRAIRGVIPRRRKTVRQLG
jgi:hypothetical protein